MFDRSRYVVIYTEGFNAFSIIFLDFYILFQIQLAPQAPQQQFPLQMVCITFVHHSNKAVPWGLGRGGGC
jgi:hypothetical protein